MDLRSVEKEKRTLRWFVRGKQQKGFFKGLTDRVEFGVCYMFSIVFLFSFMSIQISTYFENDRIEFMCRLKLKELSVNGIPGEEGYW